MEQHERFLKYVAKSSTCWLWTGGKNLHGYGQFYFNKKNGRAHRYSYEFYKRKIPKGLTIDHLCNIRSCVNPAHLEAVTMMANVLRSNGLTAQNSRKKRCVNGHRFAGYNLIRVNRRETGRIERSCRACKNFGHRKWRKKKALTDYQTKLREKIK